MRTSISRAPTGRTSTCWTLIARAFRAEDRRSFLRKAFEAWFTLWIEWTWPKRRILEVYLNVAELGDGVFGVEAASRRYFRHGAAKIVPHEAALLAAMLPSPLRSNPANPSAYLRQRQRWILRQL